MRRIPGTARTLLALAALMALSMPARAVTYNWSTGTFPGDSASPGVLGAGDTLNIVAGGTKILSSALSSSGTITALDDLYFQNGNVLSSSGLFDFQADVGLYSGYGNGGYSNTGTFRKSAGTGTSLVSIAAFTSSGTIDAQIGTIQFNSGASFGAGSQFTGAGSTLVTSGASFTGSLTSANLTLGGGTFSGSGATINGAVVWTVGSLTGDWTVAVGQQLVLSGGGGKNLNASLSNAAGTVAAGDDLYFQNGNTLSNAGVYNFQGDFSLLSSYGNGSFVNSSTLLKSAGTGTSYVSLSSFSNTGTIEAQTGTINFNAGATFNSGTVFKGPGAVVISSGASFNGSYTTDGNLTLASGIYAGAGATIQGDTTWSAGSLTGDWTLSAGKTLSLVAGGGKYLNGSFSNLGTVAAGDDLNFQNGNTLTNASLYNIQGDFSLLPSYGNGAFVNSGTLRKSAGTGTSYVSINSFSNTGTIEAQTGTINFNTGATFNSGTVFKGPGAVVISSGASFNGSYTTDGNLTLASGIYAGAGATIQGDTTWSAGSLTGDWTLIAGKTVSLVAGGGKYLNGSFSNLGTVAAGDDLNFQNGNTLTNASLYNIQGDFGLLPSYGNGAFVNSGTLRKSAGTGTSTVSINGFSNTGTIDAQTGTIEFSAYPVFYGGSSITGSGQVLVSNGGNFVGSFSTANNLTLSGGAFSGGNSTTPSTTLAGGSVNYTGGSLTGVWNTAPGTQLNISGSNGKYLNGTLNNQGTINATDTLNFQNGNTLANSGAYRLNGDVGLSPSYGNGNFVNSGLLVKTSGTGTSDVSGIGFVNAPGGVVDVQTGTIALPNNFINQGTLKGNGSYATNLLTNSGTVAPGASPGTLTIAGSFAQTASGTLAAELFSAANSDLLNITGSASLDGTLALSCYGGCAGLAIGDTITLLTSVGATTGSFAYVTLSGFGAGFAYSLIYDPNDVKLAILNVGAVPEPGTWLTLALGLGAIGLRLRPRRAGA